MAQMQLLKTSLVEKDVVYTPDWVARDMVEFFQPSGRILEPSKGDGVFLKYLPSSTEWCEINEGRDFFAWHTPIDWVFGNPPYSVFSDWITHSFSIANHVCYLIPLNKPFNSGKMLQEWHEWGRIIHMRYYANGGALGFPIGFACGAVYYQKGYFGPMYTSMAETCLTTHATDRALPGETARIRQT